MKNRLVIVVIAIFLSACATTANYEKILRTWVGHNVDDLVSIWGAPESSYSLSDGGRVLQYSSQRNIQIGGYTTTEPQTTYKSGSINVYGNGGSAYGDYSGTSTTYVQKTAPIQNFTRQCTTRFTVNARGVITKWAWQGNDCTARAPD